MKKYRIIAVLALIMLMAAGVAGCGRNSAAVKYPESSKRLFTDSVGRTIEIPKEIKKVAVTGPLTQIIFYAVAPEMLVGRSIKQSSEAEKYMPEDYLKLPILGQLYGGKGDMNLEELLLAAPDVVLDIGEPKETVKEDLDALTAQTGIPFIHISATTDTMADAIRKIGELTGLTERAEEYAAYCENISSRTDEIMSRVGENKVRALYCLGADGCNVLAAGSYPAEILDRLVDNLAVVDSPTSVGLGNAVDPEQILNWNPDFIIFAGDGIYDTVADNPAWQAVNAVKSGNYVEVPDAPYNWMGFPPSVQRYLGMIWLAGSLYPDYADYDMKAEIQEFYRLFYHIELTDDLYRELTANALTE